MISIMRKMKLLLALFALFVGTTASWAREDVTSTYLTNANLMSLEGWTIDKEGFGGNGYTDWKNDGDVPVIEFYHSWSSNAGAAIGNTKTFNFSQKVNLPAGYYRLAVNAFYREGNGNGTNTKAYIYAGDIKQQYVVGLPSSGVGAYSGSNDLYKAANAFSRGDFSNEFDFHVSEAGEIEIGFHGYIDTYCSWCILGPVTLYEYKAADYMEDYRAKVNVATPLLSEKMNATVLQALQAAIVEESTLVTVDDVQNAVSTLTNAINDANNSIASYTSLKAAIDAFDANYALFDEYGKAAADAGGAATAKGAYTNGTATDGVTEKASLDAAFRAGVLATKQPGNGLDMTPYVTNPDFNSGNFDGWTKETPYGGNCGMQGGSRMEYWAGNSSNRALASFDIYQELTSLPAGVYTISADMYNSLNDEGGDYTVFSPTCGVYGSSSNEEVALVTEEGTTLKTYTTGEVLVFSGHLRIGTKNTITPMAARWFLFDNVKLTYARQLTAEEEETIAKENAVEAYNEALAAAQAIAEGSVPAPVYANLQSVITSNKLTDGTASEYNAAAAALNEAAAAAQALVAPYAAWKEMKASADALVAVSHDNPTANETLTTAISNQDINVEAATSADAITTATSTLKDAMVTYAGVANPVGEGNKFDLTFMLTNPDVTKFWDGNWWIQPDGWYKDQTDGNFQVMNNNSVNAEDGVHTIFMEYYYLDNGKTYDNGLFNIYTKATLPIGTYTMNCYAFAKEENYSSGAANPQVYFYANDTQGSLVSSNKLTEQSISFVNESEQEVKIGLKPLAGNTYNWMGIGYVELYKVPAMTIEISENADYTPESVAGKVTLKRTLSTEKWNTFVVPFQITNEELKDAFGDDVEVAEYSEEANGEISTVSFNKMTTPAITANKPVLLKPSTISETNTYVFEDRTISTSEAKAGGVNFDFVGTYKASIKIEEGNYFISDNKLWKAEANKTTIKGTRAYLKAKSAEARIAEFSIGESETTGISTIATQKANNAAYDMQGRRVETLKKGVYVVNGKKVVVK